MGPMRNMSRTVVSRKRGRVAAKGFVVAASLAVWMSSCGSSEPDLQLTGPAKAGEQVWDERGCAGCHSIDGSSSSGPSFEGLFNREVTLDDGSTVTADEAYLRDAIVDPSSTVVDGYAGIMPEIDLTDRQVDDLIAFIRALK